MLYCLSNATKADVNSSVVLFNSPVDQFEILLFDKWTIGPIDLSINNFFIMDLLVFCSLTAICLLNSKKNKETKFLLYSNEWYKPLDNSIELTAWLITDVIQDKRRKQYLPILTSIYVLILFTNIAGLIPYSLTSTSQLCLTFFLALSVFISVNLKLYQKHGIKLFSFFLPANSDILLALLLVPIEFISYIMRPISLGVRLFVNLMSGHALLKVLIGFSWTIFILSNIPSIFGLLPMTIVVVLYILEFAVAIIQSYVFLILCCIYIQDIE